MKAARRIAIFLLPVVVPLAACARRPPRTVPPTRAGEVAYRFIQDPASLAARPAAGTFVEPRPTSDLPLPQFPTAALESSAGPAHVVVRILIDTEGRIGDVRDSPVEASSPGPFAREFRDATLRALRHWRFEPGWIGQAEGRDLDGDGTPDYRRMTRLEVVPVFYDVRFDFAIVGGEGTVTTSAAPPG
jgi:hypothetical protein